MGGDSRQNRLTWNVACFLLWGMVHFFGWGWFLFVGGMEYFLGLLNLLLILLKLLADALWNISCMTVPIYTNAERTFLDILNSRNIVREYFMILGNVLDMTMWNTWYSWWNVLCYIRVELYFHVHTPPNGCFLHLLFATIKPTCK